MEKLKQFKIYALNSKQLIHISGGNVAVQACKAAAPYACSAGGYHEGTHAFNNCMGEIYADCEAIG